MIPEVLEDYDTEQEGIILQNPSIITDSKPNKRMMQSKDKKSKVTLSSSGECAKYGINKPKKTD
jgi:hypothetical protein